MVADLCHFLISFCCCEIAIIFVFSPPTNDKYTRNNKINEALISAAKYFAKLFIVFYPVISLFHGEKTKIIVIPQ